METRRKRIQTGGATGSSRPQAAQAEGPRGGNKHSDGDAADEMQAATSKARANQGLLVDGGGVHGQSREIEAAGGEDGGGSIESRGPKRLANECTVWRQSSGLDAAVRYA
ncbi:hypothetical protein DH2020_001135 [Rehmannia glutinosa]|uniref:Uncharacterized protein n=1 Tax=Rehmannia glutinosa TaxID=99300 RepID=A0ABR0XYH1_REHGL